MTFKKFLSSLILLLALVQSVASAAPSNEVTGQDLCVIIITPPQPVKG